MRAIVGIGCVWLSSWLLPSNLQGGTLSGRIVDAGTRQPLAARVYLEDQSGKAHFVRSAADEGRAVVYDKANWINPRAIERHTVVSAHPFVAELPAGKYRLTVERGKEYFPESMEIEVDDGMREVEIGLRRWSDMASRGWYSGEAHIHRSLAELPTLMLAEDLNVALPLTYWVTSAFTAPSQGDKNVAETVPDQLVTVDATHVFWPRNTEYEIFTVGERRHTLGALFVLNHRDELQLGVPPWGPVSEAARAGGALLDMDKLDWPFGMTLPASSGATLYELANNHLWRTEFGFSTWNVAAPAIWQPPRGGLGGNERDWLLYTLGMYYSLLDAGFRLVPTAGTASGVHPVPVGFSRVYVAMPPGEPFSYQRWMAGLAAGRSFVTTGPMLELTVNDQLPGHEFRWDSGPGRLRVRGEVVSEHPLSFAEVVVNGVPVRTVMGRNVATAAGAWRTEVDVELDVDTSGWVVVRCFEDRPDGRLRFAHTAPWWIVVEGEPLRPSVAEREYLIGRVRDEIARSAEVLPADARLEYQAALERFERLEPRRSSRANARPPLDDADLRRWLVNMVQLHGMSREEVLEALAIEPDRLDAELARLDLAGAGGRAGGEAATAEGGGRLRVVPYPGGRHPRRGFLDGALRPQRDTKVSVFTPWSATDYVVIDVPEAIFTNLGLTYLAHTHVRTIWEDRGVQLEPLEWKVGADGTLESSRELPNGIAFGATVRPGVSDVEMELWARNGTDEPLTDMRAQVCVMLQGAIGFHDQTGSNKLVRGSVVAVHDGGEGEARRWIVTSWEPLHRGWQNPPVPCLHSDPRLPDCAPGATVRARGWLAFHRGATIDELIDR